MSDTQQNDWTKPAAMAIPKGGVFNDKVQQGRYGPIFPKSPACYGFTIIAKIIPGREDVFYEYARNMHNTPPERRPSSKRSAWRRLVPFPHRQPAPTAQDCLKRAQFTSGRCLFSRPLVIGGRVDEDAVGAIAETVKAGYVRYIGLSDVCAATLRGAAPCIRSPTCFVSPMTWGIEKDVIERFAGAGIPKEKISFVRDTYTFNYPGPPSELVDAFQKYYGPTMNAFEAAEKNGRASDLQKELDVLFNSQNKSPSKDATSIPATFLRVTVALN